MAQTYDQILTQLLSPQTPIPVLPPKHTPNTADLKPIPHDKSLTSAIAALQLHPVLEVLLHTINADLASAHFYVRHMQSPPAYESMLLHGLLHRYEGDIENARAWYGDVTGSSVMEFVWDADDDDSDERMPSEKLRNRAKDAVKVKGNTRKGGPDGKEIADDKDPNEPGSDAAKSQHQSYHRASAFLDRVIELKKEENAPAKSEDWKKMYEDRERESIAEIRRLVAWCEAKFGTGKYEDASDAWVRPSEKIQKMAADQLQGGEGWRDF